MIGLWDISEVVSSIHEFGVWVRKSGMFYKHLNLLPNVHSLVIVYHLSISYLFHLVIGLSNHYVLHCCY